MRKKLFLLFLITLLAFPLYVKAVDTKVKDISITGNSETSVGETITLNFHINFSNLPSGDQNTLGIWIVTFELVYDDDVFVTTNNTISSNSFFSLILNEDNTHYIYSEVIDNYPNTCVSGLLYCSNYVIPIDFYVKNTSVANSTIKIKDIEIAMLDINNFNKEYTLDDAISITSSLEKSYNVRIKQPELPVVEIPKDTTTDIKPKIDGNTFLKSLQVKNHDISFTKEQKLYIVYIDESTNELSITAEVEDSTSSYVITGADNLKENKYVVSILVTSENGDESTYTIYAQIKKSLVKEKENSSFNFLSLIGNFKFDNDILNMIVIIGGGLILLVITILTIRKIKDRKIDKQLKKFNDDL